MQSIRGMTVPLNEHVEQDHILERESEKETQRERERKGVGKMAAVENGTFPLSAKDCAHRLTFIVAVTWPTFFG